LIGVVGMMLILASPAMAALIQGDDYDNVITGTRSGDVIRSYGGDDLVFGRAGNDIINCGQGDDTAFGGRGNDVFIDCENFFSGPEPR
jgi:Ca2+-binding RTX toxin-like protein